MSSTKKQPWIKGERQPRVFQGALAWVTTKSRVIKKRAMQKKPKKSYGLCLIGGVSGIKIQVNTKVGSEK